MSRYFTGNLSSCYTAAYKIARDCADQKFGQPSRLYKSDITIAEDYYTTKKRKCIYCVKSFRVFGMVGVCVTVRVNDNNIPTTKLCRFVFGFIKGSKK